MKRILILFIVLALGAALVPAQSTDGIITAKMLKSYRKAHAEMTPPGLVNVISNNTNITDMAKNNARAGKIDPYFAVKLDIKGITAQKSTGRCWLFTGLNVIRQQVREKFNIDKFEFSENYNFFYDQLEKSNLFLEGVIETRAKGWDDQFVKWLFKNTLGDGGVWNMMVDNVNKYGLIPKEIMPDTKHGESTRTMSRMIRTRLRENGLRLRQMHLAGKKEKDLRKVKDKMLAEVYRMLAIHLGEPPTEFTWRYKDKDKKISTAKTYTPRSFFKEVVDVNLNDYIMMMNDPTRPFDKYYEIDRDRDILEGQNWTYVNLTNAELKAMAKRSLLAGEAMYFSCDVGKQLDRKAGILDAYAYDYEALYGVKFGMDKAERITVGESGSSHGMALVGVDTLADGTTTKWLLENSWGASAGHKGYLIMTDKWFDEYGFRLVVLRKFVDPKILKIIKGKPQLLPPWDPMF
ncbi:C1 family peptidase [bacterium]|nr:C1 family peptidase [bacterium]